MIEESDRLVRKYWTNVTMTLETPNSSTNYAREAPVPVKENWWDHNICVNNYKTKTKRKVHQEQEAVWKENKTKYYYFVLFCFVEELHGARTPELQEMDSNRESDQNVVVILLVTCAITWEKRQALMATYICICMDSLPKKSLSRQPERLRSWLTHQQSLEVGQFKYLFYRAQHRWDQIVKW